MLIHLLDGSTADPLAAFATIHRELAQYSARLADKPQIVGFNKMDLPDAQAQWQQAQKIFAQQNIEAYAISAATGEGVRALLRAAVRRLIELPRETPIIQEDELPVIRPAEDEAAFSIAREERAWRVRGKKVERLVAMTNFDQEEAIIRLHRIFKGMGVTDALTRAGVREGERVRVTSGPFEGLEAVFDRRLSPQGRVRVFLHVVSRWVAAELDMEDLQPVR